jgi:hypothetical protein
MSLVDWEKAYRDELIHTYPKTWRLINARRYQLPQKLSEDYMAQDSDALDLMVRLDLHLNRLLNFTRQLDSGPERQALPLVNWLQHGLKTLWMEREYGEMLKRTELLKDLRASDLLFPWPSFRVMTPFGLIPLNDGSGGSVTSIFFSREQPTTKFPPAIIEEFTGAKECHIASRKFEHLAMLCTVAANRNDDDSGLYIMSEPMDDATLGASVAEMDVCLMNSPRMESNRESLKLAKLLAFNLLIHLGTVPPIAQETECLRREKQVGKHHFRAAIYKPQWVGEKIFAMFKPTHPHEESEHTGRHLPGHWRAGHWKRQPYGIGHAQRKIIWIRPYKTTGETL